MSLYALTGEGATAARKEAVAQLMFILLAAVCFTVALCYFIRRFKAGKTETVSLVNAAMVGANGVELVPWRACGALAEEVGSVGYLNGKNEVLALNVKSKTATPIVLLAVGAVLCFLELVLNFLLPYIEFLLK